MTCERYGCDGRRYPVAEYRDRKTGEVVMQRPIIDGMDEVLAEREEVEGLAVTVALMTCTECTTEPAEVPAETCADCPEPVTPPREDEKHENDPTDTTPWWNA